MKAERTNVNPAFNLLNNDGVQERTSNKVITKVFLTNGMEYDIVPGSFHLYVTTGDRPQPYVQFKAKLVADVSSESDNVENVRRVEIQLHTVEIFPASMAGVAFLPVEEEVRPPEMLG